MSPHSASFRFPEGGRGDMNDYEQRFK
jgi:hypothetical protein